MLNTLQCLLAFDALGVGVDQSLPILAILGPGPSLGLLFWVGLLPNTKQTLSRCNSYWTHDGGWPIAEQLPI